MATKDDQVKIIEVDTITNEETSWYSHISPSGIDKWRIWPRALITLYGIMFWRTTEWFMALPEPTAPQSAFCKCHRRCWSCMVWSLCWFWWKEG